MNVFIIGITGGTGSRVARSLKARNDEVFGLYRKPDQVKVLQDLGAEGTQGDIATMAQDELTKILVGMDAIVFTAGAGEEEDESMIDAIDFAGAQKAALAAQAAGVPRFLLVSVFPEAWRDRQMGPEFEHYLVAKKKADVALAHSSLDWIILRPSALQDKPGRGTVSLSAAEIHEEISRDDVAETIAGLLHATGIRKRILEVTAGQVPIADAIGNLLTEQN